MICYKGGGCDRMQSPLLSFPRIITLRGNSRIALTRCTTSVKIFAMNLTLILSRFLWFAIWIALLIYLLLTLWLGFVGLFFPYQLDYGEGIVLWFSREIAQGHAIYKGVAGFPYASSNYPPITFLLTAALLPIFGDGYVAGRLLNLTAAIIVAALIHRIVSAEAHNSQAAALASLFFIGSPYVYHWAPLFRADLIGLAFAFAGLYCAWRNGNQSTANSRQSSVISSQKRFQLFAIGFFLLALYTKQTLLAAPAAAFLAMLVRDRRAAILFALALGAIGGAIYLAIDLATHGGFTFGLIDSNATVFLPAQLFDLMKNFVFTFAVLIALAVWEWVRRVRAGQFGVLEAYAVTTLVTLVFAGRVGAWENYFFEAIAILCVLAACRMKSLITMDAPLTTFSVLRAPLLIPILLGIQLVLFAPSHDPRIAADLLAQTYPANQQLASLVTRTNGTIISEDMGALVTSGKQVAFYTFQYSSLARSGKWDQSWELNGLQDGIFPLVILERGTREDVDHYRRFTRDFVSALDRYYAHMQMIGKYEIYTPSPLAHLQSADFGDEIAMVGWNTQSPSLQSLISNPSASLRTGLQLSIVWQAKRAITRRYTAFVHLEQADGSKVAQDDHEPRSGLYPTTRWASGEMVRDLYVLDVPEKLAAGKYVLRVGWYDAETGERLPVQGSADDSMVIMTDEVK